MAKPIVLPIYDDDGYYKALAEKQITVVRLQLLFPTVAALIILHPRPNLIARRRDKEKKYYRSTHPIYESV